MLNIRFNNSKAFMDANRAAYHRVVRDPYYQLIEALNPTMLQIDPRMELRPHRVLSRIHRDTRFSHDKSPYRDHHWLAFRRAGEEREKAVVFWFELRVEHIMWGLGFWGENRQALDILRRRMLSHPDDLLSLLNALDPKRLKVEGDSYKRMKLPEGLHPKLKQLYVMKDIYITRQNAKQEWAFSERLLPELIEDFQALAPIYQLLRGCHDIAQLEGESAP